MVTRGPGLLWLGVDDRPSSWLSLSPAGVFDVCGAKPNLKAKLSCLAFLLLLQSEYCLQQLEEWISMFDMENMPEKMEMNWDGEWLSPDFVKHWDRNYVIPDVVLELKPEFHPTRYHIQSNAVRMILPAKGILPMGSYIGSPGFGLIHPTTISAAVLQDAGFFVEDENPHNPL